MSLTIKQAFEALSDACANGMKNPFFVMRRLKESFADVASKVVDASGDKVTVTPITDSGTKIATIKVNNTTSELYAPNADESYVVAETKIGTFLDEDLYRQTISMAGVTQSGTTEVTVATIATNLKIRKLYACIFEDDAWYSCPENNVRLAYIPENGKITFRALKDGSSWNITEGYLIIEYTKVTT